MSGILINSLIEQYFHKYRGQAESPLRSVHCHAALLKHGASFDPEHYDPATEQYGLRVTKSTTTYYEYTL
jgi:hypothetical protein